MMDEYRREGILGEETIEMKERWRRGERRAERKKEGGSGEGRNSYVRGDSGRMKEHCLRYTCLQYLSKS